MPTQKIINSIKVDSTYIGKVFKVDENLDLQPADVGFEYKEVTGHPTGLTQNTFDTWTYTIADFIGPDIVASQIRGVLVYVFLDSANGRGVSFSSTLPWDENGTEYELFHIWQSGNNSGGKGQHAEVIEIPVNADQTSITITLSPTEILEYIMDFPKKLNERFNLLGPKWEKIANIYYGNMPNDLKVDALIDLDHNFGNVLSRIVQNSTKYYDFLTVKAYAERIVEFIFFIESSAIKRQLLRVSKRYENYTLENYRSDFMELCEKRYAKARMEQKTKSRDMEYLARVLDQCKGIGADNVFDMMNRNEFAWSGKFVDVEIDDCVLFNSKIVSGQFTNCMIRDCVIEGGYIENCVLVGCTFKGSATVMDSSIDMFYIYSNANPTFIRSSVGEVKNTSNTAASIDMDKLDVTIIR
jgi:hypothetical protein